MARPRKYTIVLRNSDSGEYIQVGKSCVKDYIGEEAALKEFIQKFDQVHSLGDVDLATLEALDVVLTIIRGLIDES